MDFVHKSYFLNEKESINCDNSKSINSNYNCSSIINNNKNNPSEDKEEISNFNDSNYNSDNKDEENENIKNNKIFKFSSLDLLLNPLRKKHVFELWNPFEIALFESCVCKFNKNFDFYPKIVFFLIIFIIFIIFILSFFYFNLILLDKNKNKRRYN